MPSAGRSNPNIVQLKLRMCDQLTNGGKPSLQLPLRV